jgi:hypothetical protein
LSGDNRNLPAGRKPERVKEALRSFSEVAAVPISILLYWRQLPQRPDCLWGLAMVPGALLPQVNDPAVSHGWTEEIFTPKNKILKVNPFLSRHKPTKRSVQTVTAGHTFTAPPNFSVL